MKAEGKQLFKGKKVLVLGLAKSGYAVAKLLLRLGADVTLNEIKARDESAEVKELEALGIKLIFGGHPLELLETDWDCIIKNPGIPFDHPFLLEADRLGIRIITEVEIAFLISEAPIIAITGSNGKTTTTTLVYEMLKESDLDPLIAGNIGTVFCEVAEQAESNQWIVAELSSFQLLGTQRFKPAISVLLNIFDAHLDYHRTREHYIQAKLKMFANQDSEDFAVLNADHLDITKIASTLKAEVSWFSTYSKQEDDTYHGAYLEDNLIMYRDKAGQDYEILPIGEVKLIGKHNLENILAAISTSWLAGAKLEAIQAVLRRFRGVPHRLQFIAEKDGVRYYNDSKATNGLATQKALQSFEQPVILIAGGLDRGEDYKCLEEEFAQKVKGMIVYGQIAEKLIHIAKKSGVKQIVQVNNVKEAVSSAAQIAEKGDTVLLSPAAASWDQFASFEERGDMFVQLVHMLL